jgi:hypothetical protein
MLLFVFKETEEYGGKNPVVDLCAMLIQWTEFAGLKLQCCVNENIFQCCLFA